MKLTIYSFKTFEDLKILRENFKCLGVNIMYNEFENFVRHAEDAFNIFKVVASSVKHPKILCNNYDVVGSMLCWCEENNFEAEVVYCSDGEINSSPMVDGCLTNWPFGWYLPGNQD